MKNPVILGALFVGAFGAAVIFFKPGPVSPPVSTIETTPAKPVVAGPVAPAKGGPRSRTSGIGPSGPGQAGSNQAIQDPRLAALAVSSDNGLIEFVHGPDDRVIAEFDKDPNSLGFEKPMRQYTYSSDKLVGLTSYRYFPDRVEISRTAVAYKPDGSVDEISESTTYVDTKGKSKRER